MTGSVGDPLADVIRYAERAWWVLLDRRTVLMPDLLDYQADTVRAHLAAVLDAEEAEWAMCNPEIKRGAEGAIYHIRSALGIERTT